MDKSYFGEPSLGSGRSGSSRKGKKSNSDKPKQPQRGLGVAQLEKIRLSNEMGSCHLPSLHNPTCTSLNQDATAEVAFSPSSSSYSSPSSFGLHPCMMMGVGEMELRNIRHGETQSSGTPRIGWNYNHQNISQPQQEAQSAMTRQFLTLPVENSSQKRMDIQCETKRSGNQNSDSNDDQELDLDLKL